MRDLLANLHNLLPAALTLGFGLPEALFFARRFRDFPSTNLWLLGAENMTAVKPNMADKSAVAFMMLFS